LSLRRLSIPFPFAAIQQTVLIVQERRAERKPEQAFGTRRTFSKFVGYLETKPKFSFWHESASTQVGQDLSFQLAEVGFAAISTPKTKSWDR
jgi:hypothetical protein